MKLHQETHLEKYAKIAYWFVYINIFSAGIALLYFNQQFRFFLVEDSIAENLGALFLFLTGVLLFICFFHLKQNSITHPVHSTLNLSMFFGAGILFLWASGEEISWGQRIFDYHTPEYLTEINQQKEANLHNINTKFFNNALETLILLFILIPTILYYKNIKRVFGIVIPSFHLILSFQLISGYTTYSYVKDQDYISYLTLVFYFVFFFKKKEWKNLIYVIFNILLLLIVGAVNIYGRELFPTNGPREMREYLFSFMCLSYVLIIYLDIKSLTKSLI